ncbi:MAG: site-specific integrase [Pseudomonadota bacterium]
MASLEHYAFPTLGDRPIHTINTADALAVLTPIWAEKHDTAQRVKQRMASVFDWAKGAGHYSSENPMNGLEKALPAVKRRVDHMPALAWRALPEFFSELSDRDGISARCLAFIILTASRSKEARLAEWSEINGDVWTIPAERMKRGVDHRVPLSTGSLAELEKVRGLDTDLVFPSANRGPDGRAKPMSDTVFSALTKRMGRTDFTTHGFRSTFRDWCGEAAQVEREVAEAALSHAFGDRVERAYARSDLFGRRRDLMQRWSDYTSGNGAKVLRLAQ